MEYTPQEISMGLIGLGLGLKGAMDYFRKKNPGDSCAFNSEARDMLKKIIIILEERK